MNYSSFAARRNARNNRREVFNACAYFFLVAFTLSALAFGLFVQMAVYVAQGNVLHIGADILFRDLSSVQLVWLAFYTGAFSMVSIVATAVCAIAAKR